MNIEVVLGLLVGVVIVSGILYEISKQKKFNIDYYNTIEFKCRKCKKYIPVHGIFIRARKHQYCKCEEPQYYSEIEVIEREK